MPAPSSSPTAPASSPSPPTTKPPAASPPTSSSSTKPPSSPTPSIHALLPSLAATRGAPLAPLHPQRPVRLLLRRLARPHPDRDLDSLQSHRHRLPPHLPRLPRRTAPPPRRIRSSTPSTTANSPPAPASSSPANSSTPASTPTPKPGSSTSHEHQLRPCTAPPAGSRLMDPAAARPMTRLMGTADDPAASRLDRACPLQASSHPHLPTRLFAGLDLGQRADHSALVLLDRALIPTGEFDHAHYRPVTRLALTLRLVKHWPLGTPYLDIADWTSDTPQAGRPEIRPRPPHPSRRSTTPAPAPPSSNSSAQPAPVPNSSRS